MLRRSDTVLDRYCVAVLAIGLATAARWAMARWGWGTEQDRQRSQAAGFDYHLTKPVDLAAVENVLRGLPDTSPSPQPVAP